MNRIKTALALAAGLGLAALPAAADEALSAAQRSEIEQIVHDYIVSHPEVLLEAAQALEARQAAALEQRFKEAVAFYRTDEMTPRRGKAGAKHYLIEYFDYNCGYCKVIRPYIERLAAEYELERIYVEFPILSETSITASLYGLALYKEDPEAYFRYQDDLMAERGKIDSEAKVRAALERAGADFDHLTAVIKSGAVQPALQHNLQLGRELGISGTPMLILDDKVIRGAVSGYEALKAVVDQTEAAR